MSREKEQVLSWWPFSRSPLPGGRKKRPSPDEIVAQSLADAAKARELANAHLSEIQQGVAQMDREALWFKCYQEREEHPEDPWPETEKVTP